MRRRCTAAGGSASLPAQLPGPRSSSWLRRPRAVSSLPRAASQTAATARSYRAKALTTLHHLTKRSSRHMPETGSMTGTSCSSALHFQTIRTHDDGRRDSEVVYDFDRCSVHSADNCSKNIKTGAHGRLLYCPHFSWLAHQHQDLSHGILDDKL